MKTIRRNALLLCLLFVPLARGASEAASTGRETPTDEVVIQATKANLVKMEKEVRAAERRFYERYNELNTRPEYAIHCSSIAPTGSRFTRTRCQPAYQDKAEQSEGRDFLMARQGVSSTQPPPAVMAIVSGKPDFRKNVIDVTKQNPDLTGLLGEHADLLKRYEELYRKVNGAQARPEEKDTASAAPAPR